VNRKFSFKFTTEKYYEKTRKTILKHSISLPALSL